MARDIWGNRVEDRPDWPEVKRLLKAIVKVFFGNIRERCPNVTHYPDIDYCSLDDHICLLESGDTCEEYEDFLKELENEQE